MNNPPKIPVKATAGKIVRKLLFVTACVATLVALFYAEEDWRGKHAWESYLVESKAKGVDLDWRHFIPAPVPDSQNFGALPLFKPFFEYTYAPDGQVHWADTNADSKWTNFSLEIGNEHIPELGAWSSGLPVNLTEWQIYFRGTNFPPGTVPRSLVKKFAQSPTIHWPMSALPQAPAADVLLALTRFDSNIEQVRAGSSRPYSVFPIHYDELPKALLAHEALLIHISRILELRADAELESGRNGDAVADLRLAAYIADANKSEPILIAMIVRAREINQNLQPIWEGLRAHKWTESDLWEIQQMLASYDLLSDYERSLKADPAGLAAWINAIPDDPAFYYLGAEFGRPNIYIPQALLGCVPRGWFYQNALAIGHFYQDRMLSDVNQEKQEAYPDNSKSNKDLIDALPIGPYTFAFKQEELIFSPQKIIRAQTGVNLARIACGLERWRLVHGKYPDTLEALVPADLDKLPHDLIGGEPLKYRLKPDGNFLLYSIGWNEKDDGGAYPGPDINLHGMADWGYQPESGDWVWQYTN